MLFREAKSSNCAINSSILSVSGLNFRSAHLAIHCLCVLPKGLKSLRIFSFKSVGEVNVSLSNHALAKSVSVILKNG